MSLVPEVNLALRAEALMTEHHYFTLKVEHHCHALGVEQTTGMICNPVVRVIRDHGARSCSRGGTGLSRSHSWSRTHSPVSRRRDWADLSDEYVPDYEESIAFGELDKDVRGTNLLVCPSYQTGRSQR